MIRRLYNSLLLTSRFFLQSRLLLQLKQQLHTNHMSTTSKARGLHVTESSSAKEETCTEMDESVTHHRHSNSADEGIAELDGPTSVPVLLEMLREKDDRIQVLGENISRVSVSIQTLQRDLQLSAGIAQW